MSALLLDHATQQFIDAMVSQAEGLQTHAQHLFYYLALIQLAWSGIWMAVAGDSFSQSMMQLIKMALTFSLFYAGITLAPEWIPSLINGFIEIGQQSGVQAIHPNAIFKQGYGMASVIFKSLGGLGMLNHPFVSILGVVLCMGVALIYALIAAELTVLIVKSYLMVNLAALFFAFGGSDWTRVMSVQYFKSLISCGLQLLTLYFLIGVGQSLSQGWVVLIQQASENDQLMPMIAIFSALIVFYTLIRNIPPYVASLASVGGFRGASDIAVGTTAIAAGLGVKGAKHLFHALKQALSTERGQGPSIYNQPQRSTPPPPNFSAIQHASQYLRRLPPS